MAASVGPYGAFLADGSEYRGDYGLGSGDLEAFHRPRWEALVEAGPDLLACETIPSGAEVEVLARLASETPVFPAWISFSCPGGERLADGTPVEDAARLCDGAPGVVAVAVNCTAPHHIAGLIERLASATSKPILVYPNSGEGWDPLRKTWTGSRETTRWDRWIPEWRAAGAAGFGGCCRVGPHDITRIREVLSGL